MIDVILITCNEEVNLPHALESLQGWTRRVFVVDSGSTDATADVARAHGAEFVTHEWEGYAGQKNWALQNLPLEADWILLLDADEVITADLRARLREIADAPPQQIAENGFFINRLTYFMGRPIRHCGYFPSWNLRFFRRGRGLFENRAVHEHVIIDDPVAYIREPMLHEDRRGLEHFIAKHNRYSTLEASQLYHDMQADHVPEDRANVSAETRRRRWLKRHVMPRIPLPGMWRFIYMYVLRLGFLDGRAGFSFCAFIAQYDAMVALKLRDLIRQGQRSPDSVPAAAQGLAIPEGAVSAVSSPGSTVGEGSDPGRGGQTSSPTSPTQMHPQASAWTFREKAARAVWMVVGRPLFRLSFHNWYGLRAWILRLFGAKVGKRVHVRPTVRIEVPWMVRLDDDATVGDFAILYSLGQIHIGKRSIISQYAHLCAGTHDYTDHRFPLLRTPITIGDDAWIGADAYVGPGVTVGRLSVLGARSSAYKDLPAGQVCVGNPAKPIKPRELR